MSTLREWVDLRVELVKTEIEEMIAEKQELAKFGAMLGGIAAMAVTFLLLVLGFGFSALIEGVLGWAQLTSLTAGYGVVFVLLAAVAFIVYLKSPFRQ